MAGLVSIDFKSILLVMIFAPVFLIHIYLPCLGTCLNRFLNGAFNKEKALAGTFSVIVRTLRRFVSSSTGHSAALEQT